MESARTGLSLKSQAWERLTAVYHVMGTRIEESGRHCGLRHPPDLAGPIVMTTAHPMANIVKHDGGDLNGRIDRRGMGKRTH